MDSSNRLLRFALVAILLFAALLVFAIVTAIFQPGLLNIDLLSGDESTPSLESDVSFEAADKTPLDANCSYPQAIDAPAQLASCIQRANANPDATTLELAGDLLLTSALPAIDSEIVLQGNSFTIDGGGEHRLFDVTSTGRLTIVSAILQNGSGSKGGAIRNLGQLEIMESKILSNTAVSGGGIYNGSGGRVQITASQLSGNTGVFGGGGLYNEGEGAEVQVANSQFDENASPNAGGGAVANLDGAGLLITKTHFISNSASFHGGAIYNTTAGIVRLSGVILMGNTAVESSGGAISNSDNGSTVILVSSSVISNTAKREGGGIFNSTGGSLSLIRAQITGNQAAAGGGIYANEEAVLFVEDTEISRNSVTGIGGGIGLLASSDAELTGSTLASNEAQIGGALYSEAESSLNMVNSTVSGNHAQVSGGGLYLGSDAQLTFTTIASNTAPSGGGIYASGQVALANSVLAYNESENCDGNMPSYLEEGYNLSSDKSCQFLGSTSEAAIDPQLGPLADYGGETSTHVLRDRSKAIDVIPAGANGCQTTYKTDQRGKERQGQPFCDSGAFESRIFNLLVDLEGDGYGSVTGNGIDCGTQCSNDYREFTVVTLSAEVSPASTFGGWSGACAGSESCVVKMKSDKEVEALFQPLGISIYIPLLNG